MIPVESHRHSLAFRKLALLIMLTEVDLHEVLYITVEWEKKTIMKTIFLHG